MSGRVNLSSRLILIIILPPSCLTEQLVFQDDGKCWERKLFPPDDDDDDRLLNITVLHLTLETPSFHKKNLHVKNHIPLSIISHDCSRASHIQAA